MSKPTMHCLGCGYDLEHLSTDTCPECGRTFDAANPSTFGPLPRPLSNPESRRVYAAFQIPWQASASIACTVVFFAALYIDGRPSATRGFNPWYYNGSKFIAFIVLFGFAAGCLLATIRLRQWVAASLGAIGVVGMVWQIVLWVIRFLPYS